MTNTKEFLREAQELLKEIQVYKGYKEELGMRANQLYKEYQAKKYGYLSYQSRLKDLLGTRTHEQWLKYYDTYIYNLLKKIEYLLDKSFYIIHKDESYKDFKLALPPKQQKPSPVQQIRSRIKHLSPFTRTKVFDLETELAKVQKAEQKHEHAALEIKDIDKKIAELKQRLAKPHVSKLTKSEEKAAIAKIPKAPKIRKFNFLSFLKAAPYTKEEFVPALHRSAKPELKPQPKIEINVSGLEAQISQVASGETAKEPVSEPKTRASSAEIVKQEQIKKKFALPNAFTLLYFVLKWIVRSILFFPKKLKVLFQSPKPKPVLAAQPAQAKIVPKPVAKPVAPEPFSKATSVSLASKTAAVRPMFPDVSKLEAKAKPKQSVIKEPTLFERIFWIFKPKKTSIFVEEITKMEKNKGKEAVSGIKNSGKEQPKEEAIQGWFFGVAMVQHALKREILAMFKKKQEKVLSDTTQIPTQMRKLQAMRQKIYEEEKASGFQQTLLLQEARRVKRIIDTQKKDVFKSSSIGIVANVSVKKISLWLVDQFPEFFGYLYNALRAANIKILSNTYVNIMILMTFGVTIMTAIFSFFLFILLGHPLAQTFVRSLIFSIIGGIMCATMFYTYPFMKIKDRKRSIMTNLPFAINHMSSVSTSGVPPATMFELISQSEEYGEVAVEIKKIVDYVNIFGYDLLTAMKSISATTPSPQLKEFFEGFISIIETGGNLDNFLRQKADEAALAYQLERQRYNQSINTYSDIYTGLLIAAPLFFVAALALVNLLGGKIGSINVDILMALGAYVVVPMMNIGFIIFLQLNQPEA